MRAAALVAACALHAGTRAGDGVDSGGRVHDGQRRRPGGRAAGAPGDAARVCHRPPAGHQRAIRRIPERGRPGEREGRTALRLRRSRRAHRPRRRASGPRHADFEMHPVVEVRGPGRATTAPGAASGCRPRRNGRKPRAAPTRRRYPWGTLAPDRKRAQFAARYNETAPRRCVSGGREPVRRARTWRAMRGNGCRARTVPIRTTPTTAAKT